MKYGSRIAASPGLPIASGIGATRAGIVVLLYVEDDAAITDAASILKSTAPRIAREQNSKSSYKHIANV